VTDADARIHEAFVRQCIELAAEAVTAGNEPFGAVLVADGVIRHTARNQVVTRSDPTRHAELLLVSEASQRLERDVLSRATLYTSTEPCLMCCGAIYWSRIPRVVFGCSAGAMGALAGGSLATSSRQLFSHGRRPVSVIGPILEEEALAVHRAYWSREIP